MLKSETLKEPLYACVKVSRFVTRIGARNGHHIVRSRGSRRTEKPVSGGTEESEADANSAEESADDTVCDDEAFTDAATIPPQLAELDVPFYACAHEMVAISESDPLFVGEYDTTHESILVEMSITDQFDASDWEVSERTVEGDNAITHAQKPGYTLVVAIGPSRTPEATSSVHYTLRAE